MPEPAASSDALVLTIPSELAQLEAVVDATQAFLSAQLDDEDLGYRVLLLVTEAVTNAMEHGNQLEASKVVKLDVRIDPSAVAVTVEDEGAGFDPKRVANPLDTENLLVDSGRGVFLIATMADDVQYENEGRRLRMRFNR